MSKNKVGRPTVMTPDVLQKLNQAFAFGASDSEACFYADIAPSTLYEYCNANPEFSERKEALKLKPILKARETVVKALDDPEHAKWYLSRKAKNEFGTRTELTGADGEPLNSGRDEVNELMQEVRELLGNDKSTTTITGDSEENSQDLV